MTITNITKLCKHEFDKLGFGKYFLPVFISKSEQCGSKKAYFVRQMGVEKTVELPEQQGGFLYSQWAGDRVTILQFPLGTFLLLLSTFCAMLIRDKFLLRVRFLKFNRIGDTMDHIRIWPGL